jgi:HAUS augmin-like complex subunit 1
LLIIGYLAICNQDKALAALAIEDKKRQYAAAEKYLEDVLQSALTTTGL